MIPVVRLDDEQRNVDQMIRLGIVLNAVIVFVVLPYMPKACGRLARTKQKKFEAETHQNLSVLFNCILF